MDYKAIGLKSGLEIHQQLNTNKLFCNCPSVLRSDEPGFEIKRRLHAIAGEGGEVDVAVEHEAGLGKEFIYQGYDTTCLVELDEEPPQNINAHALKIGLQVALLLNCEIIPVSQIMRKTVIDGSNTGGFQRTVLFAKNGYIEISAGKVGIDAVLLEEDSARNVGKDNDKAVWRLDRLGIPLLEIATAPDMKTPEQIKEAALHIGDILRACNVKRGIGTIRQDVNISIKGSNRVELKGFQDQKIMIRTIENELLRQKSFLDKNQINPKEVRNVLPDGTSEFSRPMPGSARMYPETDLELLKISKSLINEVKNNLPKLRGEIKEELKGIGLSEEMINLVLSSGKLDEFKELHSVNGDSNLIAKMLVLWPKDFAKKFNMSVEEVSGKLSLDILGEVLEAVKGGEIGKHEIQDVLIDVLEGKSVGEAIKSEKVDLEKVEEFVVKIVKDKPGLRINAYMGMVMKEFRGQVSGKVIIDVLKKYVK